jgi:hypothetical protein
MTTTFNVTNIVDGSSRRFTLPLPATAARTVALTVHLATQLGRDLADRPQDPSAATPRLALLLADQPADHRQVLGQLVRDVAHQARREAEAEAILANAEADARATADWQ